ncbi:MAG: hypothetical protein GXN93_02040 [Candidatus Diapherotrites archaeon]|nr:hypothetical protein [Candidatus Diapherotrites archaeon]
MNYAEFLILTILPFFESRYTIPAAIAAGWSPILAWLLGTASSAVLAAALLAALEYIDKTFRNLPRVGSLWINYVERARANLAKHAGTWGWLGVVLFVAIPLPGTGVYSGSVAAYALKLEYKHAWLAISAGAAVANAITAISTTGVISLI